MATNVDIDPSLRQAFQLLHSPNTDAAENIRKMLDDIIKQRHGSSKMLVNTLSKKHLAEECSATGSGIVVKPKPKPIVSARRSSHNSSDSMGSSSSSSLQICTTTTAVVAATTATTTTTVLTTDSNGQPQEIPVIISIPDDNDNHITTISDDNGDDDQMGHHLNDFADLACFICGRIDLSAKNRLIECLKCTLLYHQECHMPKITDTELDNDQESLWCCSTCKTKSMKTQFLASPTKSSSSNSSPTSSTSSASVTIVPTTLAATLTTGASSSSHSSGSSRKDKEHSKSSSSRHHHHHHHHHSSSSGSRSGSSKSIITPNINIISADKRLQNMKKKAAKTHESKRKK